MSEGNVELVMGVYPTPEVDNVPLYRDDSSWTWRAISLAPFIDADFECVRYGFGGEKRYAGLDGLRAFVLDWMSPWVTYRIETTEAIDLGEQVLVLNHDCGRRDGSTAEVRRRLGAVLTVRDGQIARLDANSTRGEALKAVGPAE